ncbi:DUF6689 family protein [uncultured Paraglaciecola sp.]|uniref:DUF6689 family protein n=1 Tax=uncultured Paraglaciecola sp. TaxID=1765024 RepID=UPI0030DA86BF|tara:strand:+ start:48808 stop:49638 length:831 start_codon:yes stop_codon:yes gene_type:complete
MPLKFRQIVGLLFITAFCNLAFAQTVTPTSVTITKNKLQAKLNVTNLIALDLLVEFENSIGLSANNIDISATLVTPSDASVLDRLTSNDISLISTFPVVVSISPKANSGFGFEGLASVEIYTKAVDYNAAMPARLFRSHANGDFEDITTMVSAGSIRARGSTGSFSDFVIVLDQRSHALKINDTFTQLNQLVSQHSDLVSSVLATTLQASLYNLQSALLIDDYLAALTVVDELITLVENASNEKISTVWRSSNDLINMQGELLTRLKTLRYSLRVS